MCERRQRCLLGHVPFGLVAAALVACSSSEAQLPPAASPTATPVATRATSPFSTGSPVPPQPLPGCGPRREEPAVEGAFHLESGRRHRYRSYPPTSGPHDVSSLPEGWLTAPLTSDPAGAGTNSWVRAVHSLEHGYVIVLRGSQSPQDVERLQALTTGRPKVIVAPDPKAGKGITLLAWTVRLHCDELRSASLQTFLARHVAGGMAPEPDGP